MADDNKVQMNFLVDQEIKTMFEALARKYERSLSAQLRWMIRQEYEHAITQLPLAANAEQNEQAA